LSCVTQSSNAGWPEQSRSVARPSMFLHWPRVVALAQSTKSVLPIRVKIKLLFIVNFVSLKM